MQIVEPGGMACRSTRRQTFGVERRQQSDRQLQPKSSKDEELLE